LEGPALVFKELLFGVESILSGTKRFLDSGSEVADSGLSKVGDSLL
jgi:hypothetical protein